MLERVSVNERWSGKLTCNRFNMLFAELEPAYANMVYNASGAIFRFHLRVMTRPRSHAFTIDDSR